LLDVRLKRKLFKKKLAISYVLLDVNYDSVVLKKHAVRHEVEILSCLLGIVDFVNAVYVVI
jgi:hypothetical protein